MGNFKNTKQKKLNKKTINLNQSYKKEQNQARERESTHNFCVKKIWIEWNN